MENEASLKDSISRLLESATTPLKADEIAAALSKQLGRSVAKRDVIPLLYEMLNKGLASRDDKIKWSTPQPARTQGHSVISRRDLHGELKAVRRTTELSALTKELRNSSAPKQYTHVPRPATTTEDNAQPESNDALAHELVLSLDSEIEALKNPNKRDSGTRIRIYRGRFLRRVGDLFLYVFALENFLVGMAVDDIPADVEIGGTRHEGQIIAAQGLEITVGLVKNLGSYIAEATLITNLWYLLEVVKKKLLTLIETRALPAFSPKVFGLEKSLSGKDTVPPLEPGSIGQGPNEDAQKAIELALGSEVSFVWGPPGTGKTTALARIVEAFWKKQKKVLICSHINTAVNTALRKFLEISRVFPQYEEGKFIRIGVAGDKLGDDFELCVVENITAKLGSTLKTELDSLREQQQRISLQIEALKAICRLAEEVTEHEKATKLASSLKEEALRDVATAKQKCIRLAIEHEEVLKKYQMALAAGTLRRIFTGMSPEKVLKEQGVLENEIAHAKLGRINLEKVLDEAKQKESESVGKLNKSRESLSQLCEKLGITVASAKTQIPSLDKRLASVVPRITVIENELNELGKKVIQDAEVVGVTLTKLCTGKELADKHFDVLILDEASMAPMPYLYVGLKDKTSCCIIGDFHQLPPICQSRDAIAKKWLGRSIFDQTDITKTVKGGQDDPRLQMLHVQYRMVPDIAAIPNELFYQRRLVTSCDKVSNDFLAPTAIVVCDTSNSGAWVSRLNSGSRYNVYDALIVGRLTESILALRNGDLGVITPYAAQARLIKKIFDDQIPPELQPRVSTVHRFQGSQCPTMILDSVESYPERVSILLDDSMPNSDAARLLNVAITRAETKLIIVANLRFLQARLSSSNVFMKILERCIRTGTVIDAAKFVDDYFCDDFDRISKNLVPLNDEFEPGDGTIYSEKNFHISFVKDLLGATTEVIILSPFLTIRRAEAFGNVFKTLVNRGIRVVVYTRPITSHSGVMEEEASFVVEALRGSGVVVIQRAKMHQKIALIDRKIAWEGSLNILSHRDTGEHMRRIPFQKTVEKLVEFLDLAEGEYDETPPLTNLRCSACERPLLVRKGRYGLFLSCSGFPRCREKHRLSGESEVHLDRKCKRCGDHFVMTRGRSGWRARCHNSQCNETLTIK